MDRLRIVYGGTFDPVHNGHLAVARAAAACFATDVHLLPSADPPHREPARVAATERAALLGLALASEPALHLDTRELARRGPSYSVDTLHELRAQLGATQPLAWLLGVDAFAGLHRWDRWGELLGLCHWIVAVRPDPGGRVPACGEALQESLDPVLAAALDGRWSADPGMLSQAPAGRLFMLQLAPRPESSSRVRERITAGTGWEAWVPPAVAARIRALGLYGAA